MNKQDYEKAKAECWKEFIGNDGFPTETMRQCFNYAFDRACALGREKEAITQEEIEKAWQDYAQEIGLPDSLNYATRPMIEIAIKQAFKAGTKVIGKQEKDTEEISIDKEEYEELCKYRRYAANWAHGIVQCAHCGELNPSGYICANCGKSNHHYYG